MEVGSNEPFYNLKFYDWTHVVTPTWLTHVWNYWIDANIFPDISQVWKHKNVRKNDKFLSDML